MNTPRHTAPASFLSYPKFAFFYVLLVLGAEANPARRQEGESEPIVGQTPFLVTDYNETTDYFPNKVYANHSEFWDVEYHNSYKIATDYIGNFTYVLYQRGTPIPEEASLNLAPSTFVSFMPIPVATMTIDETIPMHMIEVLGQINNIKYSDNATFGYATSPCLQKLGENVNLTLSSDPELREIQTQSTDIHIASIYTSPNVSENTYYASSISSDPGALHRAEWIEFLSLPFNLEAVASESFNMVETNYNNYKEEMLQVAETKPVIAWISTYTYYGPREYIIFDSDYKLEYIFAAQASAVAAGQFNETTEGDFHDLLKLADIVIDEAYIAGGEQKDIQWFMDSYGIAEENAMDYKFLSTSPASVFDVMGRQSDSFGLDWYEGAVYRADEVLLDVISAAHPQSRLGANHNRTWLKRTEDETPVIVSAADCQVLIDSRNFD
ncbi:hypothetical protein SARC_06257 [Sphaeroforma arctica JP610]|uniref:Fe/B12 periplasmic-binding domain-containing protein n=1 Tax=Sphaeroforma arctica JP610 TaxID=667725 RepID=A0A0L0FXX7_9EUKA|nr:hypothetical protein SARC_06257 [Sphaeroforma arctica JP610]KNC81416.1 hypothetical protein SARC_06257 [Sphaeroforma arctica JP610]|eukprot:XP_014155318.1 hypothetical protein SARC_06257 [Sphaeroforma arctica JP610]